MTHTKGRLRVCDAKPTATRGIDIIDGYQRRFASVPVPKFVEHTAHEDADRLAACWNALEGLDPAAVADVVAALEFVTNVARSTPGFSAMAIKQSDTALARIRGEG